MAATALIDVVDPVRRELERVEEELFRLSHSSNARIADAVHTTLRAGGKRLRPAVLLLASKAAGARAPEHDSAVSDRAIRMAAAVELVHTASLLHDDVVDEATERRGLPSVNARWGNKICVLAGDHLFSSVVDIAARDGTPAMVRGIADAARKMAQGQIDQSMGDPDASVDQQRYLDLIAGKTAVLFACSARVGAEVSLAQHGRASAMASYGHDLGMAFQIVDDVLDVVGERESLGKGPGIDVTARCWTLPYIRANALLGAEDRTWMHERFRDGYLTDSHLDRLRSILVCCGALQYSAEQAGAFGARAKQHLLDLHDSPSARALTA